MRISVALCTYNGSKFLPEQLFSIQRQSRLPDEVVICDDGSTDDTLAIAERFAAESVFSVRIHRNEKNLRSTKNFENAIGMCQADVIVTADQDDVWYADKLLKIEKAFEAAPDAGLVFSDADVIDSQGRPLGARLWPSVRFTRKRLSALRGGDAFMTLLRRSAVTGATMAFRSRFRDQVMPIPCDWFHDEWIALLIAASTRVVAIEEPLIQYRRHAANQIGVSAVTASGRTKKILATSRDFFHARAERYEELREALARLHPDRHDLLAAAAGKVAHFEARAALPGSRMARVPGVFGELIKLNYSQYSGTSLAFARDLLSRA